ncbi:MAG TPA: 50S ribosomal protein L9 [Candidatus Babeliales bacterium]|nr:50S ribosomal protein L9 [Candidatus Babeliales bacterium]
MRVFLLKDVEKIGLAGEIIKVSDGFGSNFLIPHKLGVEVTPQNEKSFVHQKKVVEHRKEVIATKTSMLAEKIKSIKLVIKRKLHDGEKLYGSISPAEIVDLLAEQGISVAKNQVEFNKAIKTKGSHEVTIKLSSTLQPKVTVNVVAE